MSVDNKPYKENIKEIDNRVIVAKAIASCLEYIEYEPLSKATPKEIDQNEAWKKNTKYKSWKAFWKNNNMLYFRIEPNGEFLLSARKKTVDGGRGEYNDIYQSITLPSTTSYEDIAKKVVEMLKEVEEYYSDKSNIPGY